MVELIPSVLLSVCPLYSNLFFGAFIYYLRTEDQSARAKVAPPSDGAISIWYISTRTLPSGDARDVHMHNYFRSLNYEIFHTNIYILKTESMSVR